MVFTINLDDGTAVTEVWIDGVPFEGPIVLVTAAGWGARDPGTPVEALSVHNNLTNAANFTAEVAMAKGVVEGFKQGKARRKNGKRDKHARSGS